MENGASANEGKDPSSFLGQIIGNPVTVKLNSGVVYKGKIIETPRRSSYGPSNELVSYRRVAVC